MYKEECAKEISGIWKTLAPKVPQMFRRFTGGGGSSIVKVPGDVLPTRAYFFGLLVKPRVYFLAILVEFSLGKGMPCSNFGQSTVKIQ